MTTSLNLHLNLARYLVFFAAGAIGEVLHRSKMQSLKCKTNNYVNNLDAPDAHFGYSSLFSDVQVEKVGNPTQKM
jgi:hypothetical protein